MTAEELLLVQKAISEQMMKVALSNTKCCQEKLTTLNQKLDSVNRAFYYLNKQEGTKPELKV